MKVNREELVTVPNVLTISRLVISPFLSKKMHDDTGKWWPWAGAFAFSDNFDGFLARAGDKHESLARLGFRRSELGRKLDPVVDKVFVSEMLIAGLSSGVVPKRLGAAALAQKAFISAQAVNFERQGVHQEVSKLGKRSEFATNLGIGTLFVAESLPEDSKAKEITRAAAITMAAGGIAAATLAALDYRHEAANRLNQMNSEAATQLAPA